MKTVDGGHPGKTCYSVSVPLVRITPQLFDVSLAGLKLNQRAFTNKRFKSASGCKVLHVAPPGGWVVATALQLYACSKQLQSDRITPTCNVRTASDLAIWRSVLSSIIWYKNIFLSCDLTVESWCKIELPIRKLQVSLVDRDFWKNGARFEEKC